MRLNVTNQPEFKTFRTRLRKNLTPAEAKFWKVIQGSKLDGRKFRRQQSIGKYVFDFYCPAEKLAIELDGEVHYNELAIIKDQERKLFVEFFGIKVIRFENRLVFENLEYVLGKIRSNFGWRQDNDLKSAITSSKETTTSNEIKLKETTTPASGHPSFERRGAGNERRGAGKTPLN